MLRKILWGLLILLLLLTILFALGPKVEYEKLDLAPINLNWKLEDIDSMIYAKESQVAQLKDDNEARVIWADSSHQKTPYSVVYIHGFSASQGEGDPIHRQLSKSLGANLFLARLKDHGISTKEAFKNITPQAWVDDAKEALAIGRLIGDEVIVVSCSTGGTISIALAPEESSIHSLILLSPNIEIAFQGAEIMTMPWGEQLIEIGGEYRMVDSTELHQYWSGNYHKDGLLALQGLIDQTMNSQAFDKIDLPIYMGYYYKNKLKQDKVVSVPAMLDFYDQVQTRDDQKHKTAFANAGGHVISSKYRNDNWEDVYDDIMTFLMPKL